MAKTIVGKDIFTIVLILLLMIHVSSCAVAPQEYKDESPVMDMKIYFNGPLQAWGLFQDYREKVIKRFHVNMLGTWNQNTGTLEEDFTYSDGTTQRRVWTLVRLNDHTYSGTADDVIGKATGEAYGHALRWQYTLALNVDDGTYHVKFDDWMWQIDDETVINRSVMSKFGVTLGEVILVFRKPPTSNTSKATSAFQADRFSMPEVNHVRPISSAVL